MYLYCGLLFFLIKGTQLLDNNSTTGWYSGRIAAPQHQRDLCLIPTAGIVYVEFVTG